MSGRRAPVAIRGASPPRRGVVSSRWPPFNPGTRVRSPGWAASLEVPVNLQNVVFPARLEDLPRVEQIWEASVRATHDFVTEADIDVFRPLVAEAIRGDVELACIRDADDLVVGFLGVAEGKVEMLFVDPLWFGRGIGGRLLWHAVSALGATSVDVNEQNGRAVRFYLRRGFEVAGRSEQDSLGKPYPLLHLRRRRRPGEESEHRESDRDRAGIDPGLGRGGASSPPGGSGRS
jgi:putative acetyltransferase